MTECADAAGEGVDSLRVSMADFTSFSYIRRPRTFAIAGGRAAAICDAFRISHDLFRACVKREEEEEGVRVEGVEGKYEFEEGEGEGEDAVGVTRGTGYCIVIRQSDWDDDDEEDKVDDNDGKDEEEEEMKIGADVRGELDGGGADSEGIGAKDE